LDAARLTQTIFPLVSGLIGLFLIGTGIAKFAQERAFARRAVATEGTIVGFERRRLPRELADYPRPRYVSRPTIAYTTRDGQPARFHATTSVPPHLQLEGQRLPILYDPADPTAGRIAGGRALLLMPLILIGSGLFVAGSAVIIGLIFQLVVLPQLAAA
jgi:hypothetical protein